MGNLKKFVKWTQKRFILKWVIGIIIILVGITGLFLPLAQGILTILVGVLILIPNKKLSKRIFKHEKLLTYSIIGGFAILLIIPAVLYYTGIWETGYGHFALATIQVGQEPIKALIP